MSRVLLCAVVTAAVPTVFHTVTTCFREKAADLHTSPYLFGATMCGFWYSSMNGSTHAKFHLNLSSIYILQNPSVGPSFEKETEVVVSAITTACSVRGRIWPMCRRSFSGIMMTISLFSECVYSPCTIMLRDKHCVMRNSRNLTAMVPIGDSFSYGG